MYIMRFVLAVPHFLFKYLGSITKGLEAFGIAQFYLYFHFSFKFFSFQTLSESTHTQLKKNVYQNYRQFIDTAKEISFLESEMYQLSHMITDQRNLLFELMQFSVNGEKVDIELADQILEKNDSASNASKTNM